MCGGWCILDFETARVGMDKQSAGKTVLEYYNLKKSLIEPDELACFLFLALSLILNDDFIYALLPILAKSMETKYVKAKDRVENLFILTELC